MNHCMIDIETMGNGPRAAVLSIGAVFFNPDTGDIGGRFLRKIDFADAFKHGQVDASTVKWWLGQSEEARDALVSGPHHLSVSLMAFNGFLARASNPEGLRVWGNGPTFDITILENAYRAVQLDIPWKFWGIRDCRTIREVATAVGCDLSAIDGAQGVRHDAMDDAIRQAHMVSACWRYLINASNGVAA